MWRLYSVSRFKLVFSSRTVCFIKCFLWTARWLRYSWFHENGSFSVHNYNEHYLSIPEYTGTVKYSKETGLFTEQNAGFSAQIHSVTLTKKPVFLKRHVSWGNRFQETIGIRRRTSKNRNFWKLNRNSIIQSHTGFMKSRCYSDLKILYLSV